MEAQPADTPICMADENRAPPASPVSPRQGSFLVRPARTLGLMSQSSARPQSPNLNRGIMDVEELKKEVAKIDWWHSIDLGNGVITPGVDRSSWKLKKLRMPQDLSGMSVLDIGAWDGFFSFEAERRGAKRVLAVDSFCWNGEGWGTKAGFILARKALRSKVEDRELEVLDISPEKIGTFDLVWFSGVLYHMPHPLLSLERVFSVTGNHLILETAVDMQWCRRPALAFYPAKELGDDSTNWWGPNAAAVEAMLKTVGFQRVERVWRGSHAIRLAGSIKHSVKEHAPFLPGLQRNHAVFHAWR
jgi:tRNA (mo5U34)-methyltransferase